MPLFGLRGEMPELSTTPKLLFIASKMTGLLFDLMYPLFFFDDLRTKEFDVALQPADLFLFVLEILSGLA